MGLFGTDIIEVKIGLIKKNKIMKNSFDFQSQRIYLQLL